MANKTIMNLIEVTPTLSTGAYAVGDVMFVPTEIPNFFPDLKTTAEIKSLTIIDRGQDSPVMQVYLTNDGRTTGTINETADADDTVMDGIQCMIPVIASDYIGGSAFTDDCNIANITSRLPGDNLNSGIGTIVDGNRSTSLYIFGILGGGAKTFAATDLTFKIGVKYH